jgi:hypothetical protein
MNGLVDRSTSTTKRLRLALDRHRVHGLVVDELARRPMRALPDDHAPDRGHLLES